MSEEYTREDREIHRWNLRRALEVANMKKEDEAARQKEKSWRDALPKPHGKHRKDKKNG